MAFPETNWSMLAVASLHGDATAREALSQLCQRYWQPVFAAIRGWGYPEEEARDHTQGFFEHLLERSILRKADQGQGRFRTFLLTILWRFINDDRKKQLAKKRWGDQQKLPWEAAEYEMTEDDESSFSRLLDYEWAMSMMQRTLETLEAEVRRKNGAEGWVLLRRFLPGSRQVPLAEEAAELLGVSPSGARTEIHRLRNRFREVLRRQLMGTVTSMAELDEEIRYLGQVLQSRPPEEPVPGGTFF